MRVVMDTNVLVSALLLEASSSAYLITCWRKGYFTLLTASLQIEELQRVTRYPKLRSRLKPSIAGRLINELRDAAVVLSDLPEVDISRDPYDNYLLALATAGKANYLISGDKPDLLALRQHDGTKIVSVRDFMALTRWVH